MALPVRQTRRVVMLARRIPPAPMAVLPIRKAPMAVLSVVRAVHRKVGLAVLRGARAHVRPAALIARQAGQAVPWAERVPEKGRNSRPPWKKSA